MAKALTHAPHFRYQWPVSVGIESLSARQREVVHLRCAEGLSNEETAHRLGLSAQTTKNIASLVLYKTGHTNMCGVCTEYGRLLERAIPLDSLRAEDI